MKPAPLPDLDPAIVELVKALARSAAAKDIARLRSKDSPRTAGASNDTHI
ncbi:hypothetical protein [Novosphingobium clariflavum]|uniref:Transposase n=1 Tax=Novosphingobium clariflavum TaxID=2029884 RepID=A0ABV6S3E8_9SPHN|nr:hypothetical protein [Novosphingobium clariflavum]